MTDDQRRIMEQTVRESPVGQPSFVLEALVPTGVFTAATYLAFRAGGVAEQASIIVAATVCVCVLLWRVLQWDEHGRPVSYSERTRYVDETPQARLRPVTVSSDEHRWKVGKFDFSESEWRKFAQALTGGRLARRAIADLQADNGERLFANITETYPAIVAEFKRLGWVDEDNTLTAVARGWFGGHSISLPE